jgi:phosphoribosylamine--glycine ligase
VSKVLVAPGNGGTAENIPVSATDIPALLELAREQKPDLTVVGPDDALALGVVDAFRKAGLKIFGPSKAAAEIEASKVFAKGFMAKYGIPTAAFKTFTDYEPALEYLSSQKLPVVVKASGLALGKGVIIAQTMEEAEAALREMLVEKKFGEAGREVVIEEFLEGPEISIHALSDGKDLALLPSSQDHKQVFDGGKGPNTGGMGTVAPLPWVSPEQMEGIRARIVEPALAGLVAEDRPFSGILYPGLKMTPDGPKVLEFNARWGDPETQSYMRLLKSDAFELFLACAEGRLSGEKVEWESGAACCVVMASGGYPGSYEKGKEITGIADAEKLPGVVVFHAGTALREGKLATSGGRVLGVTATGPDLEAALTTAYEAVSRIKFEGAHWRKDIGATSL